MLFNSFAFFVFLIVVFAVYWLLNSNLKLQNIFLLISSYFSMDGGTGDFWA